jgi:hypothetical protein
MGLAIVALLAVSSCSWRATDHFEAYRDKNLIADAGKSIAQFATGYETHALPVGASTYVAFTKVTDAGEYGTTSGLPAGAEIYRLQIPSLLLNGDFEGPEISHWSATGTGTATIVDSSVAGAYPIAGRSLGYDLPVDQLLSLDLTAPGIVSDTLVQTAEYALNFDYNASPNVARLHLSFTTDDPDHTPQTWEVPLNELDGADYTTRQFPETTGKSGRFIMPENATTATFRIGKEALQQGGHLDNIRLCRTDIRPFVELSLSAEDASPERPYIAGDYYEFSVYVKPELSANVTPDAPGNYRANGVTLRFNDSVYAEYAEWPVDTWTKVTHRFGLSDFELTADNGEPVIRLRISPTVYSDQDAGSLLIASPELEFNPPLDRALH